MLSRCRSLPVVTGFESLLGLSLCRRRFSRLAVSLNFSVLGLIVLVLLGIGACASVPTLDP
jgi:hypothetical protein